ncbi:CFI-box-CTERM domain-containing protein [Streptococcus ferus]|uniref:CFI-box-CTERM domain-containing protein n=1 Tax=Streptococcus ferus TaxID=1345 RepID=UPI0035A00A2D
MSYSVLRKGKVIMSNFSTQEDAQKYVDEQCWGFFGIDEGKKREYEIRDDGGCYLTTATVDFMGLQDNCEELTVLRAFRDGYMKSLPKGEDEIRNYYKMAPKIVDAINSRIDRSEILSNLYYELIVPCVSMIKSNKLEEAYQKYKNYTLELESDLLSK